MLPVFPPALGRRCPLVYLENLKCIPCSWEKTQRTMRENVVTCGTSIEVAAMGLVCIPRICWGKVCGSVSGEPQEREHMCVIVGLSNRAL